MRCGTSPFGPDMGSLYSPDVGDVARSLRAYIQYALPGTKYIKHLQLSTNTHSLVFSCWMRGKKPVNFKFVLFFSRYRFIRHISSILFWKAVVLNLYWKTFCCCSMEILQTCLVYILLLRCIVVVVSRFRVRM